MLKLKVARSITALVFTAGITAQYVLCIGYGKRKRTATLGPYKELRVGYAATIGTGSEVAFYVVLP